MAVARALLLALCLGVTCPALAVEPLRAPGDVFHDPGSPGVARVAADPVLDGGAGEASLGGRARLRRISRHPLLGPGDEAANYGNQHPAFGADWPFLDPPTPLETTPFTPFSPSASTPIASFIPYFAYLDYDANSIKSNGRTTGAYVSLAVDGVNSLEVASEYTDIDFRGGFELNQTDTTGVWTMAAEPIAFRVGGHYIDTNDVLTENGFVVFAGTSFFRPGLFEAGSTVYVSRYENYLPDVTIVQLTPKVGGKLYQGRDYQIRGELIGYYIHTDAEIGLGQRRFYSVEARAYLLFNDFSMIFSLWEGTQTFAVRNDGFTVWNLNEKHTSGFGFEFRRKVSDHVELRAKYWLEEFQDFVNRANADQSAVTGYVVIFF